MGRTTVVIVHRLAPATSVRPRTPNKRTSRCWHIHILWYNFAMSLYHLKDRLRPFVLTWRRCRRRELRLIDAAYGSGTSYSQFGEDAFLNAFFGDVKQGYYVDVGAFHPYEISNTYLFYRRGWRGINIEPNPDHFRRFPACRPGDININAAVSTQAGVVPFTCDGHYSGIDDHTHLFRGRDASAKRVNVEALPLSQILDSHLPNAQAIDFLSVDCEGHDREVLESNDWGKYRPRVVLVEDQEQSADRSPRAVLSAAGYRLEYELHITKVFVRAED